MSERRGDFRISVTKDELVFASAHFITLPGHRCEGLHGHNYRVSVTLEGRLNRDVHYVFDFVQLKSIMQELCSDIDHLVLLPLQNNRIQVAEEADTVKVTVDGALRYVFPRRDCALLPIPNTTAEMLAQLLSERLKRGIEDAGDHGVTAIEMEVEENVGQAATHRLVLG
jgi:6-pyruvoyltetrahydropterin/6-carboxytetrahydropterin synthase